MKHIKRGDFKMSETCVIRNFGLLIYDGDHELNRSDYVDFHSGMGAKEKKTIRDFANFMKGVTKTFAPEQPIYLYGEFYDQKGRRDVTRLRTPDVVSMDWSDGEIRVTTSLGTTVFVTTPQEMRERAREMCQQNPNLNEKRGYYRSGYSFVDMDQYF